MTNFAKEWFARYGGEYDWPPPPGGFGFGWPRVLCIAAVTLSLLTMGAGPLRLPPDQDGGVAAQHDCPLFPDNCVWNSVINRHSLPQGAIDPGLPVHSQSQAWLNTILYTYPAGSDSGYFHVNLGGTNGHYLNPTATAYQLVHVAGPGTDAATWPPGGGYALYPYTVHVTQTQIGDPDKHCLMLDTTNCLLYEMYRASFDGSHLGTPRPDYTDSNACWDGVKWDTSTNSMGPDSCSSADEAGLCISAGIFTYYELHGAGYIHHALRFQSNLPNIDWQKGSWLWPARHASHPGGTYKTNLVPFGARLRLRSSFVPTGNAAGDSAFLVMTQAMKDYGAMLADRGTSMLALSGASDARWGAWPDSFKVWSGQWMPFLEFVDQSGRMVSKNSMEFRSQQGGGQVGCP